MTSQNNKNKFEIKSTEIIKSFVEMYPKLLMVLNLLVIVGLILSFVAVEGYFKLYILIWLIAYLVVMGFVSVVMLMHENLKAIRQILESQSTNSNTKN